MLKILVLGLSEKSLAIIRQIGHLRQISIVGVVCPEGSAATLGSIEKYSRALEEISVPLLKSPADTAAPQPDLIIDTEALPKEAVEKIVGRETFDRCSIMTSPSIETFAEMVQQYAGLKEMRVLQEAIIGSTQDAITVVDEKGTGILVNRAYTRLTGLTEEDVIGKPATVDIAEGESIHMKVLHSGRPITNVKMKVGPGKKEVVVTAAPIVVDGQIKGSVGVIHDVSEIKKLTEELSRVRQMIRQMNAKYSFDDLITESRVMLDAMRRASEASKTPATVLLIGESGTGKELFAHAIHNASPRHGGPFVRVNCSAIAESLMESELFGYEEGAFTGAKKGGRKGLFEEADKGTLFLDEISKMNLKIQAELLRVLQEKEVTRVGAAKSISVDARVIVATNSDLEAMIREGMFREDLYYRLNVVPVVIPPLRERKEDIPKLVHHMIRKFNQEYGRSVKNAAPEALEILKSYHWPGNVRELENVVGRAMINVGPDSDTVGPEHLSPLGAVPPPGERADGAAAVGLRIPDEELRDKPLKDVMEKVEKDVILKALKRHGGNKTETAKALGIAIRNLYYKIEKYEIDK